MHANEKVAPTHHEFVPAKPAADPLAETGYVAKPYEFQEYPKHVQGLEGTVTVYSREEEEQVKASKSAE